MTVGRDGDFRAGWYLWAGRMVTVGRGGVWGQGGDCVAGW